MLEANHGNSPAEAFLVSAVLAKPGYDIGNREH
jgi:hypothetical protein